MAGTASLSFGSVLGVLSLHVAMVRGTSLGTSVGKILPAHALFREAHETDLCRSQTFTMR